MSSTDQVKEFHKLFGHPIGESPESNEALKIRQLRIKLLFEELKELSEAGDVKATFAELCIISLSKDGVLSPQKAHGDYDKLALKLLGLEDGDKVNKIEELDAICDIQYVLDGKKLTSGLHTITDKAFELVHTSNMCKAHISHEHAEDTIKALNDGGGYLTEEREGRFVLLNASGKVIKPHNHKKVDLSVLFKKEAV